MTETCSNCRFGHAIPWSTETATGVNTFCREQPPEFIPPGSSTLKPAAPDGWCGQWSAKKAPGKYRAKSCECGMTGTGRCAVCMKVAS